MTDIIRNLRRRDGDIAAAVHARCFEASGGRAWRAGEFVQLLRAPGCFGLLLLANAEPAGLALARVAADEAELLTFGVVPPLRRRGHGGALLSTVRQRCRRRGALHIFLEVADDNLPARCLYEACGFAIVARRENYFERADRPGRVAALVMRANI